MRATNWTVKTDRQTVAKRAGGRRHFNAWRRARALWRLRQVIQHLGEVGFGRGNQAEIARRLGLHPSTICRDLKILKLMENNLHISQIEVLKRTWHQPPLS